MLSIRAKVTISILFLNTLFFRLRRNQILTLFKFTAFDFTAPPIAVFTCCWSFTAIFFHLLHFLHPPAYFYLSFLEFIYLLLYQQLHNTINKELSLSRLFLSIFSYSISSSIEKAFRISISQMLFLHTILFCFLFVKRLLLFLLQQPYQ